MSSSTQSIASAFNAATGMGNLIMLMAFAILALIVIFYGASALLAQLGLLEKAREGGANGAVLFIRLLIILCGISFILFFFSLM